MARPLLTLDLRNLKVNEPVDTALFSYTPPEKTPAEDQTEAVIKAIKASIEPAPAAGAATKPAGQQ